MIPARKARIAMLIGYSSGIIMFFVPFILVGPLIVVTIIATTYALSVRLAMLKAKRAARQ